MKYAFRILISVFLLWMKILYAEVRIEITQGINSGRPIAIIPFFWDGIEPLPEDISLVISSDLRNSGKFNPLESFSFPQKIRRDNIQELHAMSWSALNISAIIMGHIHSNQEEGDYSINYQLIGIKDNDSSVLIKNSFKIHKTQFRYIGHAISDEVFEKLTGIKGNFCTRISYVIKDDRDSLPYALCVSDYDGYNQFIVHRASQPLMSPTWSADGSKLAYVTFEKGRSELVVQNLISGSICKIADFPNHNGAPSFSPDGTKLAFALSKTGSLNLYIKNLITGQTFQITNNNYNNTEPTWFPDNQNLAFTSDQAGNPQIYKINIQIGSVNRISWYGTQNQNAKVSSDGKFMIMVNIKNGKQCIIKQDLLSGAVQILSSTFLDETPSLSPNNTMVIYCSFRGTKSMLHLVSVDGYFRTTLPLTKGDVKFPSWSPCIKK